MIELPLDYLNKLGDQILLISTLLGGFSLTVLVLLLEGKSSNRLMSHIFKLATLATGSFLVTIFAMTSILMITTEGYPFKIMDGDLSFPKVAGIIAFLVGIISVISIVSISGWTKSKNVGRFTTLVGIITLIFVFLMLT